MIKKWITATSILTLLTLQVHSQKLIIPEKKIYESPDGKIYIQKDLPVYLRIGTSPDNPANTVQLNSETTSQYANPMYFDTEGYNSFHSPSAVDKVTKQVKLPKEDIIFEVYADSHPPVTTIHFGDSKVFKKNGKIHLNGKIAITFTAKDELSGVDKIMYSLDSADYKEYSTPLNLEIEKEYVLKYYSYDNVGNIENVKRVVIVINKAKPGTTIEIKGDRSENILSGRAAIVLKTEPDISGIAKTVIKFDDRPERNYIEPVSMALLSQGDHKLIYYSVDNVGNQEDTHEFDFYVDKTPPTILQDIAGKSFLVNGKEYSSGQSMLKITAIDNKAGVKEVFYSINNGSFKLYEKPVLLNSAKGILNIKVYATDKVNNRSEINDNANSTKIPYIDLSGPVMNYSFTGPVFITGDTIFISNKTKIHLSAIDYESGVNNIQFNIDKGVSTSYQTPFSIEKEGTHFIEFIGTDNVENTTTSSFNITVDNSGPVIYPRFSTLPKGNTDEKDTAVKVYPSHVVLFVAATDIGSGYDHMLYSINDLPSKLFSGLISGFGTNNSIIIKAYDKLGNETVDSVRFKVK